MVLRPFELCVGRFLLQEGEELRRHRARSSPVALRPARSQLRRAGHPLRHRAHHASGPRAVDSSDVNLFTMTALLIKHNGSVADATTEFQSNLANGQLNQQFVDQIIKDRATSPATPTIRCSTSRSRPRSIIARAISTASNCRAQYFFGDTGFGISGSTPRSMAISASISARIRALTCSP